jgi:hypothetical protein
MSLPAGRPTFQLVTQCFNKLRQRVPLIKITPKKRMIN